MTILEAVILGLVEGVTEYLPISSTGHLILATSLMGMDEPPRREAVNAYLIVIQGGAILAVLGLYLSRVRQIVSGVFGRDRVGLKLAVNLLVAFLPALLAGPLLGDAIERWLFRPAPVLVALLLGGVYMMLLDRYLILPRDRAARANRENSEREHAGLDITELSARQALLIGLFQIVAMWPGTSRSMMTITAGVLAGLRPRQAAEFSFLLGLPTLGGAMAWTLWQDFRSAAATGGSTIFEELGVGPIAVGLVVSTIAAGVAVKWLVAFLARHGLTPFGWYRIALALVMGLLIWMGAVSVASPL